MGKISLAAALAVGLAACTSPEAGAEDRQAGTRAELVQVAAVTTAVADTKVRTMRECRILASKAEKITCMTEVRAATQAGKTERAAEIAALDAAIETEQENNELRRTTVEVLSNIKVAALEGGTN